MLRNKLRIFIVGLVFSLLSFAVQAQETSITTTTTTSKPVIVTPAPKAVCSSVAGHWEDDVWVDTHDVCKYENRTEGVAWVNPYWSCTTATADGTCTAWVFVPGHWVKTLQ